MEQPFSADISYIGRTTHRNSNIRFGIRQEDRFSHMYIVGKTGTGKSTLLGNLARQDLEAGRGFALLDPHGDLIRDLAEAIPAWRRKDVLVLQAANPTPEWRLNPFASVAPAHRAIAVANLVEVFRKIWLEDWGPRLEHLLRSVAWTLIETPGGCLADIPRLLTDRDYRRQLCRELENAEVKSFWWDEFEHYSPAFRAVVVAPLQNKIGAILMDPLLREVLGSPENTLELGRRMNSRGVLLIDLSRGRIGESAAGILGAFLTAGIGLAAFRRASNPLEGRVPFFLYLDEFHLFATASMISMLSELRKYRVGLVLAHQYLSQIEKPLLDALFGNVGSLLVFRVSVDDAKRLAEELHAPFDWDDLAALPNFDLLLSFLVQGHALPAFSARTESP